MIPEPYDGAAAIGAHLFGIALATADGQIYEVGDSRHLFTIQSISKPFVHGLALEDHGMDYVLTKVGVELSGGAFNSVVFDKRTQRPFNPMVNAGTIATTALIKGNGHDDRLARLLEMFSDEPAVCYVLPIAKLEELAARNPEIRTELMCNIGRELSARLRRADVEIRSQEE